MLRVSRRDFTPSTVAILDSPGGGGVGWDECRLMSCRGWGGGGRVKRQVVTGAGAYK